MSIAMFGFRYAAMGLAVVLVALHGVASGADLVTVKLTEPPYGTTALRAGNYGDMPRPDNEIAALFMGAIKDRVDGRMSRSVQRARSCYERTRDDPKLLVGVGAACQELVIGARYVDGDLVAWANEALALQDQLQEVISPQFGGRRIEVSNYSGVDLNAIAGSGLSADVDARGAPDGVTLPRGAPMNDGPMPGDFPLVVQIRVNGVRVPARVDTGSSSSTLSAELAGVLDLPVVTSQFVPVVNPRGGDLIPSSLVRVDDLELEGIHVRNVGLLVSDVLPNIIGLDLIRKLSPVLFSEGSVSFMKRNVSCEPAKAVYSSGWIGDLALFAVLEIDGKSERVHVDTGAAVSVAARPEKGAGAGEEAQWSAVDAGGAFTTPYKSKTFRVGNVAVPGQVWTKYPLPVPYRIGSGIFATYDLWVDALNMKVCLIDKHAGRKP